MSANLNMRKTFQYRKMILPVSVGFPFKENGFLPDTSFMHLRFHVINIIIKQ